MRTAVRALFRHAKNATSGVAPVLAGSMPASVARFSHAAGKGAASASHALNPWLVAFAAGAATMPFAMAEANQERSFIMIKPDGVHRGLIADIIQRFECKGYKLVGIKILVPTEDLAGRHYSDLSERPFFPKLVKFLASGPVVAMVWEGKEVIKYGRTLIGATNPLASAPGTIRGDFGIDVGRNVIHGSDSVESAQKEIALWFDPAELASWEPVAKTWIYE